MARRPPKRPSEMHCELYLSGKLEAPPEIAVTKNGKEWLRLLLKVRQVREPRPGEFQTESVILPISCFSREASAVKNLRIGDPVIVGVHLQGTRFQPSDGPPKYGVQLVADEVLAAGAMTRAPLKEALR
jgi:single-stranded DNA-binding protein